MHSTPSPSCCLPWHGPKARRCRYTAFRSGVNVVQTKETVKAVLDQLPDDCSLEDVLYHLYVVQAVAQGRAEVQAGKTIPHEQVAEELRQKWVAGRAR